MKYKKRVENWGIAYLENPSQELQIASVKRYVDAIAHIPNPSEEMQMAAVQQYGDAIQYIDNPSEAVQIAAVKQYWGAIKYIDNPSEAVQLAAVKVDWGAIQFIKNPSEAVQMAAVNENGYVIRYIINPGEAVQMEAVNENGYAIQFIKNPSEAVQMAAVNENGDAIRYIKTPSEAVIKYLKENAAFIFDFYFEEAEEEVKQEQVSQSDKTPSDADKNILRVNSYLDLYAAIKTLEPVADIYFGDCNGEYIVVLCDEHYLYFFRNFFGSCSECDFLDEFHCGDNMYVIPYKDALDYVEGGVLQSKINIDVYMSLTEHMKNRMICTSRELLAEAEYVRKTLYKIDKICTEKLTKTHD